MSAQKTLWNWMDLNGIVIDEAARKRLREQEGMLLK